MDFRCSNTTCRKTVVTEPTHGTAVQCTCGRKYVVNVPRDANNNPKPPQLKPA